MTRLVDCIPLAEAFILSVRAREAAENQLANATRKIEDTRKAEKHAAFELMAALDEARE